jgi:hypothetical protein
MPVGPAKPTKGEGAPTEAINYPAFAAVTPKLTP